MADFAIWQAAFPDEESVTLISYPALNHMFNASGDPGALEHPTGLRDPRLCRCGSDRRYCEVGRRLM